MPTVAFNQPFSVLAPAKLNLRLKITGRRPDGYHELASIMVPVGLFDLMELQFIEEPGIHMTWPGAIRHRQAPKIWYGVRLSPFFPGSAGARGFPWPSPKGFL